MWELIVRGRGILSISEKKKKGREKRRETRASVITAVVIGAQIKSRGARKRHKVNVHRIERFVIFLFYDARYGFYNFLARCLFNRIIY